MGWNLSEDLYYYFFFALHLVLGEKWDEIWVKTFFFLSSPDFGRKMGRNLSVTISNSDVSSSQNFWTFCPPPPLFKILRTLLVLRTVADLENFGGGDFKHKTSKFFADFETEFSAEISNSKVFFAQNKVDSKKKKGLRRFWDWIFGRYLKFKGFFSPKIRWSPKKKQKKKGLHRNWEWFFGWSR